MNFVISSRVVNVGPPLVTGILKLCSSPCRLLRYYFFYNFWPCCL